MVKVHALCHAAQHTRLALKALDPDERVRKARYRDLRGTLRRSRDDEVVEEVKRLAAGQPADSDVWTEIRYLESHGAAGRLQYATFRRRAIPCGSGAVESVIRRVINQRLKSNTVYWCMENAEALFAICASLMVDRWEETLQRLRRTMARDRHIAWQWDAPDTTISPKPSDATPAHSPQHLPSTDVVPLAA